MKQAVGNLLHFVQIYYVCLFVCLDLSVLRNLLSMQVGQEFVCPRYILSVLHALDLSVPRKCTSISASAWPGLVCPQKAFKDKYVSGTAEKAELANEIKNGETTGERSELALCKI